MHPKIFELKPEERLDYLVELQDKSCILSSEERQIMEELETQNQAWAIHFNQLQDTNYKKAIADENNLELELDMFNEYRLSKQNLYNQ